MAKSKLPGRGAGGVRRVAYYVLAVGIVPFAVTGCTRAEGYIVIYNQCAEGVALHGSEGVDGDVVPAREAHSFVFKDQPVISVELPEGATIDVDMVAWRNARSDAPDGELVIPSSVCSSRSGQLAFEILDSRDLSDKYRELITN